MKSRSARDPVQPGQAERAPRTRGAMATQARAGRVRIIGGLWKRSLLPVPDAPGLRPTPDRVRETLFNWLGQDLRGARCLDLFAGSGALGFEAASRGAQQVVLVEQDARIARALRDGAARLKASQIEIVQADAIEWLERAKASGGRFDLVFLDPPFGQGWLARILPSTMSVLAPTAKLYVESDEALDMRVDVDALGLHLLRHGRAGQVHYHLLEIADNSAPP